jgi:hypothetical protein
MGGTSRKGISDAPIPPWSRVGWAILLMTGLSVACELYASGGLPTADEIPSVIIGSTLIAALYAVSVLILGAAAWLGIAYIGIPGWATFPALFTLIAAALVYEGMSGYEFYEQAGVSLVSDHHFTAAGWTNFRVGVVQDLVISALAGAVLFWNPRRAARISN